MATPQLTKSIKQSFKVRQNEFVTVTTDNKFAHIIGQEGNEKITFPLIPATHPSLQSS